MNNSSDIMPHPWPWNLIDQQTTQSKLAWALEHAEDGELFFERKTSESITLDDGRIKTANYTAHQGFGLRGVTGERASYAHSSELSAAAIDKAARTVNAATKRETQGQWDITPNQRSGDALYAPLPVTEEVAFEDKVALLNTLDAYARDRDPRVVQVTASILATTQEICILRYDGAPLYDFRPMVRMNVQVIVQSNARRETGTAGGGGRHSLSTLLSPDAWQAQVNEAIRVATVNLDAIDSPAGTHDIVIGAGWPGILLHEAIGHGLEADANRKGSSVFHDKMNTQIAAQDVTVYDDGTLPQTRGALHIDDEGTPTQRTTLIENGQLVGYMQDRMNARLMNTASTGNGRRESYAHLPMPRMTNTYMANGTTPVNDMIADLKDGIYAVGFGGGQVDTTSGKFVFSCTEAYLVRNGTIGAPLKGATLIGDGATALTNIRAVGNDWALDPGMGTCGKQGQWVPVGVGQPSLLIGGLTVGGGAI